MTNIVQVSEGIFRIDIGMVTTPSGSLPGYSLAYLIVDNGEIAIVDPGPASAIDDVLGAIVKLGYAPGSLSNVILTHIHMDHAGAAGEIARRFPNVKMVVHKRGAGHIVKPDMLIEGTRKAYGQDFEKDYGPISPVPRSQVVPVDEGDIVPVGARNLKIIYTPGHAPHHISIYDVGSEGVFSGDSLGFLAPGNNSVIIVAGFDLELALDSIDRTLELDLKRVYAAHGTTQRESYEFIRSVRNTTKDYGDIILKALKSGLSEEEMSTRLIVYHRDIGHRDNKIGLYRFDEIIPGYVGHFKRKGVV